MRVLLSGYNGTMGQVLKNYIQDSTDLEIVAGVGRELLEEKFPTYTSYESLEKVADVIFAGEDEVIEIKHTALSKKMFAKGSVTAAQWLNSVDEPRLYSMKDVLGIE